MRCPVCGSEVDKNWKFCPKCGARLKKTFFEEIFEKFSKEFAELNKMFEREFEAFDITPFFKPKTKGFTGFTIRITSKSGQPPKVSIKTFGNVDKEKLQKEVEKQLGIKPKGFEEKRILPVPKITEEPKTEIRRLDSKVLVDMEIPGVKSAKDIEIKELQESVEVKAIAGEKAYFKILTKPARFKLVAKHFKDGKLQLEFA